MDNLTNIQLEQKANISSRGFYYSGGNGTEISIARCQSVGCAPPAPYSAQAGNPLCSSCMAPASGCAASE